MASDNVPRKEWHRWFAWRRVDVDAYHEDEIQHGALRFTRRFCFVERRWETWLDEDADEYVSGWRYRLIRPAKEALR